MDTRSSFARKHLARPRLFNIASTWGIVLWLLCSLLALLHPPSSSTHAQSMVTGHGCAPNTPPPVAGTPVAPPATAGIIWINEVLSNPNSVWNCSEPSGSFSTSTDSWIELYNPQNQPFDLYAVHAEISLDGGTNWSTLPFGSAIASGGFLVVFPLENATTPPPAAWNLVLAFPSVNAIIDQASVPALLPDQSYARVPDGSASWQLVGQPTIAASNNASAQPVTATPTKTPTSTRTPTLTPTPTSKPARGGSSGGTTGAATPINAGTQPAGNQLQLPSTAEPLTTTPGTQPLSFSGQPPPGPAGRGLDLWHLAALGALLLLFCGALAWCWRLFRTS